MEDRGREPARILIMGIGRDTIDQLRQLASGVELEVVVENGQINRAHTVEERCETLGVLLEQCEFHAACMGISIHEYLDMVERAEAIGRFTEPMYKTNERSLSFAELLSDTYSNLFVPEPDDEPSLTDAQIRKQLKYEKNPMRIKQLNKMLHGKRR